MNKLIIIVTILCLSKTEVKSQEPNFKINCINLFKEYPFNPNDKDKLNSVKKTISKESVFNLVQAYFPEADKDFRELNLFEETKIKKFKNIKIPKINCEFYGTFNDTSTNPKLDGYGILEIERAYFSKSRDEVLGEFTLIPVSFSNGTLKPNSILVEPKHFQTVFRLYESSKLEKYSLNLYSNNAIGYVNELGNVIMNIPNSIEFLNNLEFIKQIKNRELYYIISRQSKYYDYKDQEKYNKIVNIAKNNGDPIAKHKGNISNRKSFIVRGTFQGIESNKTIYSETKIYKSVGNSVIGCTKYSNTSNFSTITTAEIFYGNYYPFEELITMSTKYPRIGYKLGNDRNSDIFEFKFNLNKGGTYDTIFYVGFEPYNAKFSFFDCDLTTNEVSFVDNNFNGYDSYNVRGDVTEERIFALNNIKSNRPKGYGDLTLGEASQILSGAFQPIAKVATPVLIALDKVIPLENFFTSSASNNLSSSNEKSDKISNVNNCEWKLKSKSNNNAEFQNSETGTKKVLWEYKKESFDGIYEHYLISGTSYLGTEARYFHNNGGDVRVGDKVIGIAASIDGACILLLKYKFCK